MTRSGPLPDERRAREAVGGRESLPWVQHGDFEAGDLRHRHQSLRDVNRADDDQTRWPDVRTQEDGPVRGVHGTRISGSQGGRDGVAIKPQRAGRRSGTNQLLRPVRQARREHHIAARHLRRHDPPQHVSVHPVSPPGTFSLMNAFTTGSRVIQG